MRSSQLIVVFSLLLLVAHSVTAQPFDDDPATVTRISAGTPVEGAVAVSQIRFPDDGSATLAVLATDADYADAMAGAILTAPETVGQAPTGPLLLTGSAALDPLAASELTRVLVPGAEVLVLGGSAALADRVLDDVRGLGFAPRRIFGASRFETAAAIAGERAARTSVDAFLLARGDAPADNPTAGWADAISGSTDPGAPILLTGQATLHPAAHEILVDASEVVLLGGTGALSADVEAAVPASVSVSRIAGAARDETAAEFARVRLGITVDTAGRRVTLYNGYRSDGWAYGLTAATLARDVGAALMPANQGALAGATARLAGCGTPADVVAMGDETVLPDPTVQAHRGCPDPPPPAFVLDGVEPVPGAVVSGPVQPAIDAISAVVGPPTEDTGWVEGCPFDGDGDLNERFVYFGEDLLLTFYRYADGDAFLNWRYRGPSTRGFTTDRGLSVGATNAEIGAAYPEARFYDDQVFGPKWEIPTSAGGPMTWFVEGNRPSDRVDVIYGGDVLYCD